MNQGRNDPCSCGSGKKYKRCCLVSEYAAELERRAAKRKRIEDEMIRASEVQADPSLMTPTERESRLKVLSVLSIVSAASRLP